MERHGPPEYESVEEELVEGLQRLVVGAGGLQADGN